MLMSKGNDSQCLRSNIRDIVQNTNGVVSDAPGYVYSVVACVCVCVENVNGMVANNVLCQCMGSSSTLVVSPLKVL